jgi:predicted MFS family arabinose efflux permease
VHVTRDLGYDAAVLGVILTGYGVGTVVGALITAKRATRRPVAPFLIGGNLVAAAGLVAIATVPIIPVMVAVAVMSGIAQSLVLVTYVTVRAAYSPDELLGRIGSTARTISLGLQPVGLLVGGALIDLTSGSTTIVAMGVAIALVSLVFAPVRVLRTASLQPR